MHIHTYYCCARPYVLMCASQCNHLSYLSHSDRFNLQLPIFVWDSILRPWDAKSDILTVLPNRLQNFRAPYCSTRRIPSPIQCYTEQNAHWGILMYKGNRQFYTKITGPSAPPDPGM